MPNINPVQVSEPTQNALVVTSTPSPLTLLCEACGLLFDKAEACRIGNSDYCPSCDEERWNELIALQEELHYGSTVMLSDWNDHTFAGMF